MSSRLRIVLPDGSMQEKVLGWFEQAGLPVLFTNNRNKIGTVSQEWIEMVALQRPQEIPFLLEAGYFDLGITGYDWLVNSSVGLIQLHQIACGRSGDDPVRIVLAAPQECTYQRFQDFPVGCTIATEYVGLAQRYFAQNYRQDIRLLQSFGNTEHKIRFGACAVIDLTETGLSLRENNLRIIDTLLVSGAEIVANPDRYNGDIWLRDKIDEVTRLIVEVAEGQKLVSNDRYKELLTWKPQEEYRPEDY